MSHFLFVARALRERSSQESAELQLSHGIWGLCTDLIRENLQKYVGLRSRGLVYVLKQGLCAEFDILPPVRSFHDLDELLKDELRSEARFGFVNISVRRRWTGSPTDSHALLQRVLNIPDSAELTRRLGLGMHRLTDLEYESIVRALGPGL